jgi:hypothetical protein
LIVERLPQKTTLVCAAAVALVTLLLYDNVWISGGLGFWNPVFHSQRALILSYLLCLSLVVLTLVRGRAGSFAKAFVLTCTAVALAFPFVSPRLHRRHELYAQAAPGFGLQRVTGDGRISNALKSIQREHESSWCTYRLHGWTRDNVLYYESSCQPGYRQYDPTTGQTRWVVSIPKGLRNSSPVDEDVADVGQGFDPAGLRGFDASTRYPVRVYERVRSPNGQWLAAAIREYYGPHDIVVLRPTP